MSDRTPPPSDDPESSDAIRQRERRAEVRRLEAARQEEKRHAEETFRRRCGGWGAALASAACRPTPLVDENGRPCDGPPRFECGRGLSDRPPGRPPTYAPSSDPRWLDWARAGPGRRAGQWRPVLRAGRTVLRLSAGGCGP